MIRRLLACVSLMCCVATPAYAFRPFDSTDAAVAEAGRCEIELGPVGYRSDGDGRVLVVPAAILNVGIRNRWELVVEGKNTWPLGVDTSGGLSLQENAASLKGILRQGGLQGRSGPSIALELSTLLPAGGSEHGLGQAVTGILSQRWAAATLHVNGTLALTRSHDLGTAVGIILEGPARWAVRPVGEVVVEREGDTSVTSLIGAIWDVHEHLSVDAGWRASTWGTASHEFRAGVTFSFALWQVGPGGLADRTRGL
jgi:opacity protein-like surface antigen